MAGVTKNNPIVEVEAPNAAYAEDHGVRESRKSQPSITPEIAEQAGIPPGEIRLEKGHFDSDSRLGEGEVYIEAKHGREIREMGYPDTRSFVNDVARNFTSIMRGKLRGLKQTYVLVKRNGKAKLAFIELAKEGDHYKVITAFPAREDYMKNKKSIWDGAQTRQPTREGLPPSAFSGQKDFSYENIPLLAPNGKPSNLTRGQWEQVRTPEFKAWFGDWEAAALARMPRHAAAFGEAESAAQEFLNKPLTNKAKGMTATVSGRALSKMTSASAVAKSVSPETHTLAVANLDRLFENARLAESNPDRDGSVAIKAIHRFAAPMFHGGELLRVNVLVKEFAESIQGNRLYTVEAVEIAKPARNRTLSISAQARRINVPHAGFTSNIDAWFDEIKAASKAVDINEEPKNIDGLFVRSAKGINDTLKPIHQRAHDVGRALRERYPDVGYDSNALWNNALNLPETDPVGKGADWIANNDDRAINAFARAGFRGVPPEYKIGFRYKDIPKIMVSQNHTDGHVERGVSIINFLTADTQFEKTFYDVWDAAHGHEKFIVGGWYLGNKGSDGEPLLSDAMVIGKAKNIGEVIKSATGNRGTFGAKNPDIRESRSFGGPRLPGIYGRRERVGMFDNPAVEEAAREVRDRLAAVEEAARSAARFDAQAKHNPRVKKAWAGVLSDYRTLLTNGGAVNDIINQTDLFGETRDPMRDELFRLVAKTAPRQLTKELNKIGQRVLLLGADKWKDEFEAARRRAGETPASEPAQQDMFGGISEALAASPPARGLKPAALQKIVDRFNADYKGAAELDIRVVADTAALEREVNRYEPRYRAAPNAEGAALDNIIWLVAENLPHGKRAREVILHEAVGHYGLKRMMGDSFTPLARFAMRRHTADMEKTAREYGFDLSTPEGQGRATEELLAQWAEKNPRMGLVRRFIAKFRQWLREIGFHIELSDSDVLALVTEAGRRMREGTLANRRARAEYVLREDAAAPVMSRGRKPFYPGVKQVRVVDAPPSGIRNRHDAAAAMEKVRAAGPYNFPELRWMVGISSRGASHIARKPMAWRHIPSLKNLLENSTYGWSEPLSGDERFSVHVLIAIANVEGKAHPLLFRVKSGEQGRFMYDLLDMEIVRGNLPPVVGSRPATKGSPSGLSTLNVSQILAASGKKDVAFDGRGEPQSAPDYGVRESVRLYSSGAPEYNQKPGFVEGYERHLETHRNMPHHAALAMEIARAAETQGHYVDVRRAMRTPSLYVTVTDQKNKRSAQVRISDHASDRSGFTAIGDDEILALGEKPLSEWSPHGEFWRYDIRTDTGEGSVAGAIKFIEKALETINHDGMREVPGVHDKPPVRMVTAPMKALTRREAREYLKSLHGFATVNQDTGWGIHLTSAGIGKTGDLSNATSWEIKAVKGLPELMRVAVRTHEETPRVAGQAENIKAYHNFVAPLKIGNRLFSVRLLVREHFDKKRYYEMEVFDLIPADLPVRHTPARVPAGDAQGGSTSTVNIRDLLASVNKDIATRRPMIRESRAWHGSPHTFDRFSTERVGTGEGYQMYGWGLYFASAKDVARNYQKERSDGKYQYDVVLSEINQAALSPIKLPGSVSGQDGETAALTINIDDLMRGVKIPVDAHDVRDIPGARESLRLYSSGAAEYNQKPGFAEYHERLLDTRRDTKTSPPAPVAFSIVQVAILAGSRFETPGNVGYACNALQAQGGESWLTN